MDLHGYYAFVDIQVDSISDSAEYIGMECPIQPDRQNQRERVPRGIDLHGYYAFVDLQVDSISDSAEYIGKECPIPDRQNQGEKIHRGVELHSYDVFVDILSQTKRNTLAKSVHTARQIKPGRKNSQRHGPSRLLRLHRNAGRFYPRLSGMHWH